MNQPLQGVRVLELGMWVAAPAAGTLLADWGASVIKIEPPGGDPLRGITQPGMPEGSNPWFQMVNRGKRSMAIDLRR
ncbi:MAG: CoA transferase, partial [Pseudomonadales bacterium]|nr:CoA transferase [Pseudomonadales bacterium]